MGTERGVWQGGWHARAVARRGAMLAACLLLLAARPAAAQPASPSAERPMLLRTDASERLLREGRRDLFAFRMDAAEVAFDRLAARPDGAVAGQHHRAMVALFKALVTDGDDHFETFYARSDALHEVLDETPPSRWRAQVAAEDALLRTLAAGKADRRLKAAWAARSAFGQFDDLLAQHPSFAEPYMGMGLLHFAVGSLPSGYRRVLSLLGFGGTTEQGLEEMQRAARGARLNQTPAKLSLALFDVVLFQQPARGAEVLGQLYREDPKSLLYALTYGFALIADRRVDEGERILRAAADRAADPQYFFIPYIEHHLADALFRQGRYAEAETHFRRYLARHRGASLKAMAYLHLGQAVEMQGRRAEAVRYYEQVATGRDFVSDEAAARQAERLIAQPMTPRERLLLRGQGAYDSGRYAQADSLLRLVAAAPAATDAERAEAAYRRGRVLHAEGQLAEALQSYRAAAEQPGDPQAKWGPWSVFYVGLIHEQQGRPAEAAAAFERVLAVERDYDFDDSLREAAEAALRRVERG